jgi:hypothetical protein
MTPLLLTVAKVALIAFIVGGVIALIVRARARSTANGLDPRWNAHRAQPGCEASVHGAMPVTPLPEWVDWDKDDDEHPNPGER